jgi:hypothetical protein
MKFCRKISLALLSLVSVSSMLGCATAPGPEKMAKLKSMTVGDFASSIGEFTSPSTSLDGRKIISRSIYKDFTAPQIPIISKRDDVRHVENYCLSKGGKLHIDPKESIAQSASPTEFERQYISALYNSGRGLEARDLQNSIGNRGGGQYSINITNSIRNSENAGSYWCIQADGTRLWQYVRTITSATVGLHTGPFHLSGGSRVSYRESFLF